MLCDIVPHSEAIETIILSKAATYEDNTAAEKKKTIFLRICKIKSRSGLGTRLTLHLSMLLLDTDF